MPVSACVSEVAVMPRKMGGLGISSFKHLAQKMCLQKRHALRASASEDVREIWKNTSTRHVATDQIIVAHDSTAAASKFLKSEQQQLALNHVLGLQVQGALIKCVTDSITSKNIQAWAAALDSLPSHLLTLLVKHYYKCCPPRPTSR